eukprot:TRINITY_DN996_c0_g3_i1.p1 TRINITY_DN996_c0_g3~~TRINITY_DN996_c0_g3_i1.p1  ORF type:complete len:534 (+),score=116.82 TRINITY_DN996_c0_g3_i1:180-1781(+)
MASRVVLILFVGVFFLVKASSLEKQTQPEVHGEEEEYRAHLVQQSLLRRLLANDEEEEESSGSGASSLSMSAWRKPDLSRDRQTSFMKDVQRDMDDTLPVKRRQRSREEVDEYEFKPRSKQRGGSSSNFGELGGSGSSSSRFEQRKPREEKAHVDPYGEGGIGEEGDDEAALETSKPRLPVWQTGEGSATTKGGRSQERWRKPEARGATRKGATRDKPVPWVYNIHKVMKSKTVEGEEGALPCIPVKPSHLRSLKRFHTLRAFFKNIVLILNYNSPDEIMHTAKFWRMVYGRLFDNVVIIAPEGDGVTEGVVEYTHRGPGDPPGFFMYTALPGIMEQHPSADGFLFTNDDLILNYWNLPGADKDRIWFSGPESPEFYRNPMEDFQPGTDFLRWWELEDSHKRVVEAVAATPHSYIAQLRRSQLPHPLSQMKTMADCFYIPQRHAAAMAELVPIYQMANVRSEVALAMMLYSLDHPADFDSTALKDILYIWGNDRQLAQAMYNTTLAGLHPWKLRRQRQQELVLVAMAAGDPTL